MKDGVITAFIGMGGVVLGSAGAFLSTFMSNRSQDKRFRQETLRLDAWKKEDIRREMLEEVYVEFDAWHKALGMIFATAEVYMEGTQSKEEFDAICKQVLENRALHFDRVEFLVAAYFPNLDPALRAIVSHRDRANELRPIRGASKRAAHSRPENIKAFDHEMSAFMRCGEDLKLALIKTANEMLINTDLHRS
jgi:hypothetical protein